MAQNLGRISGPLLKKDLLRNGVDLAFETDLLYLDVNNQRIGIKNSTPQHELDVNGTTKTTNLIVDNQAIIGEITIDNNNIQTTNQYLNLGSFDNIVYQNKLRVDSINIEGNVISTNNLDSSADVNLELRPNGNGTVEVLADMNVTGNIHATGNISADGNIQLGDADTDNVVFNAEVNSDIIPDVTRTYSLGSDPNAGGKEWNDIWVTNIFATSIDSGDVVVDGVDLKLRPGNTFYVSENGNDTNSGDHPQDPFFTIEQALTAAQTDIDGGAPAPTIVIYPGTYTETFPLTIPVGVTVKGQGIRSVFVQPTVATQDQDAFLLNGETTIEDITVGNFYYNSTNNTGYAFKYAPGFTVTSRSPYIKNISVITSGSTTTAEDPRGFNSGDAGKGVYLDGSIATASSKEASGLFHSVTFITPGVDAITLTNGVRVEWLNSFTYFANRSIYAFDSSAGLYNDGKTRIRLGGITGTVPATGQTVTFTSSDSSTVVGPLTIDSVENNDTLLINGKNLNLVGFDTTPQSITFSGGGSATSIENLDLRDFGAEIRLIGSASVYGNFGLVGDGPGVLMYAIGHNLAYIGNGKEVTNDPLTVIQDNEIIESNDAQIRYNSVDHKGDFRVGDLFYVNQEDGSVSFNVTDFTVNTENGITISDGTNTTYLSSTSLETGNLVISGNTISSTTGPVNIESSETINLNSNVNVDGNLDVTGNVTIGGNITIGDEATDTIQFVAGIDSDIIPAVDSTYSLGTTALRWKNLFINEINVDDIQINDNYITTTNSNANLDLRANGTGEIYVPTNNVVIENNLTVNGVTTLQDTNITGDLNVNGDVTTTGNYILSGNLEILGEATINAVEFEEIIIQQNFITTSTTNSDLELRAAGTGNILLPENDLEVVGNLSTIGDINGNTLTLTGLITSDSYTNNTILIDNNNISIVTPDTDLTLQANGTGEVVIPSNDVILNNNLTVQGQTTLSNTDVAGNVSVTGDIIQTGNLSVIGDITNGNIVIDDNYITTTDSNSDLELRASGTGSIIIPDNNVEITNSLSVTGTTTLGNTNITGTVTHIGNYNQTGNLELIGDFTNGNILIDDNAISTTDTNSNLELRANGNGEVLIPANNVIIDQNLTVSGFTSLSDTNIIGTVEIVGNTTHTGNFTLSGDITNGNILINDNFITTTESNSDLELRASGTGKVIVPSNDVEITNNLQVLGNSALENLTVNGTFTNNGDVTQNGNLSITGSFTNGNIVIDDNYITTTDSNSDLEIRAAGSGEILIPSNTLRANALTVSGLTTLSGTSINGDIGHFGNTTHTGNYSLIGKFENGNVVIDNNVISTSASNSDLELRANGTGVILVSNNDVSITGALDVTGLTTLENTNVSGTITHVGNTTQTGNYTITGTFSNADIQIDANVIETTLSNSDLELRANGTGVVRVPTNNVTFSQSLTVNGTTDLKTTDITGTVTHVGDVVQTGNYTIAGQFSNGDILIDNNVITTQLSNSDLELRANGVGEINIPTNNVSITQNLTVVNGTTTLGDTNVVGDISLTGDLNQTGDATITGNVTVSQDIDVTGQAQFKEILIDDNYITTTSTNADLELRAAGTGKVIIPNNDLEVSNNLEILGSLSVNNITSTGTIRGNSFGTGDIVIDDNFITTTLSNSNLELRANGVGEILVPSNDVVVEQDLTVNGTATLSATDITGNLSVTGNITHVGNTTQTGDYTLDGNLTVTQQAQFEEILIDDNYITTTSTNADLELRAAGTGKIVVPTSNVQITNNLDVQGTLSVGNIVSTGLIQANKFSTGDILVDDNYITTTISNSDLELRAAGTGIVKVEDLSFASNVISSDTDVILESTSQDVIINSTGSLVLPAGTNLQRSDLTGAVRFNTESNLFEGYDGTNWVGFEGLYDLDRDTYITAELTPGANDGTIRFYSNGTLVADLDNTRLSVNKLVVDDITIDGNVISTSANINLQSSGTGSVVIENFAFNDNKITNTVPNSNTVLETTGDGYFEFSDPYGVVLPVGDNATRPAGVQGMVRYNTQDARVELYDGTSWVSVAGATAGISFQQAEEIAIEKVLIFG